MNDAAAPLQPRPTSPLVIRADAMRAWADAARIRDAAEAAAAEIRAAARSTADEAVREGHREGIRRGIEAAALLAAETADAIESFWQQREVELQDLAFAIAHRILASLPADEALRHLAREAIDEHRREVRLTLRVTASDATMLRAALASCDPTGRVAVEADPDAGAGSCTLVHPRGRTRIGLVEQFRALMRDAR